MRFPNKLSPYHHHFCMQTSSPCITFPHNFFFFSNKIYLQPSALANNNTVKLERAEEKKNRRQGKNHFSFIFRTQKNQFSSLVSHIFRLVPLVSGSRYHIYHFRVAIGDENVHLVVIFSCLSFSCLKKKSWKKFLFLCEPSENQLFRFLS
jgi:hypothetical protein